MRNSHRLHQAILAALACISTLAMAQEVTVAPQVVVTATRLESPIEEVNASIQVIDRATIESFSGRSLGEILQYATGITISDRGQATRIEIRGMSSGHTLLLVDGMRRTDRVTGSVITSLQLEDIERIEIVRGPMSALYGSDAMGGVINIITRKPGDGSSFGIDITAGGTDDGQRESLLLGGFANWLGMRSGHRLSFEAKDVGDYRLDTREEPTDLGQQRRYNLAYRGNYTINLTDTLAWGLEYGEQDDSGIALINTGSGNNPVWEPAPTLDTEERYHVSLNYDALFGEALGSFSLGHGVSDSASDKGDELLEATSIRDEFNGQFTLFPLEQHTFSIGYGYVGESLDTTTIEGKKSRNVNSLYLQDLWRLGAATELTLGVRHDEYNDFGSATSPRIGLAWRPGAWSLRAGYGEAFRAPTLMNMYAEVRKSKKVEYGNPDLEAEKSRTAELAVGYRFGLGQSELVVFRTETRDLITKYDVLKQYNGMGVLTNWEQSFRNIDKAEIDGVEWVTTLRPTTIWRVESSVEYLDARDAATREHLNGTAEWTLRLDNILSIGAAEYRLRLHRQVGYWGSGEADGENTRSDHTTVDIRIDYALSQQHSVFMGVDNILDEREPDNMLWGGSPSDPGARFVYAGYRGRF